MHTSAHTKRMPLTVRVGGHIPGLKGLSPIKPFSSFPVCVDRAPGGIRPSLLKSSHSYLIFTIQMSTDILEGCAFLRSLVNEEDWLAY